MKTNGKPSTCYSDNPKMGKPYQPEAEGYRDGGRVPEFREEEKPRLNLSVGGSGKDSKNYGYGGRMGVDIPTDSGEVSVGVSGGGYKAGKMRDFSVTGADVSYRKGDTTIGVALEKDPTKLGDKRVMFRYSKEF